MTGVVNLTLCCFLLFVNPWRASSIQIFAKLLKEDHVLNLEHFGTSAVSSPLQCLYRCHRKRGCHGMNIGRDESGSLICQLTASQARDDEDENAGLLEEKHGWDCYSVFDPNRHWMEIKVGVKLKIRLSSFAQQGAPTSPSPSESSYLRIDGSPVSLSVGINVVSLTYDDLTQKKVRRCSHAGEFSNCANFLNKLLEGTIIAIVVVDTAVGEVSEELPKSLKTALERVGMKNVDIRYRQPFCFINMVQRRVTWKQESLGADATKPSNCSADIF